MEWSQWLVLVIFFAAMLLLHRGGGCGTHGHRRTHRETRADPATDGDDRVSFER